MKLLHIDSSALGAQSVTREISAAIVARWQDAVPGLAVAYRDLDAYPLPHLSGGSLAKANPAEAADAEGVLALFLDAEGKQRPAIMGSYGIGVERLTRFVCGLEAVWQARPYPKVAGVFSP